MTVEALTLWTPICRIDQLVPDRGVCALVGGRAVAVFRCSPDDALYAIGNHDPYCDASVLSRGIVGTVEVDGTTVPFVASPMRKHRFDLRTGRALGDPEVTVGSWPVRIADGVVEVTAPVAVPDSSWRNDLETVA
jgi:NAD(P)H-dependent nitrite reductase small subunit